MPKFRILRSNDPEPANLFVYRDGANPIGDPSAFARVYRGGRDDSDAIDSWIIKESTSSNQRAQFEQEFEVTRELAEKTQQLTNNCTYSPYPVYLLERVGDKMPGLAMPFYSQRLDQIAVSWAEDPIVEQMVAYLDLLRALHQTGYICTDRKLSDLRWHDGHLVVIDWNLLRPLADTAYHQAELSLFCRLWYGLLTGREPMALNAFNNMQWHRLNVNPKEGEPPLFSIGLRLILERAISGYYPDVDALRSACIDWGQKYLPGRLNESTIHQLQVDMAVSERKATAIAYDLAWRQTGEARYLHECQRVLASLAETPDDLEDIRHCLESARALVDQRQYPEATRAVKTLIAQNDSQYVVTQRWLLFLESFDKLDRNTREELHKERESIFRVLQTLQQPLADDLAGTNVMALRVAQDDLARVLQILPAGEIGLSTLLAEVQLRLALCDAQDFGRSVPRAYLEALQRADEAAQAVPYATELLQGFDLADRIEYTSRSIRIAETAQQSLRAVHEKLESVLSAWEPGDPPPDMNGVTELIHTTRLTLGEINPGLVDQFQEGAADYRRIVTYVQTAETLLLDQVVQDGRFTRSMFPGAERLVQELIQRRIMAVIDGLNQAIQAASIELDDMQELLGTLTSPSTQEEMTPDQRQQVAVLEDRLAKLRQFTLWLSENRDQVSALEVVQKAQETGISIYNQTLSPFLEKSFGEAIETQQHVANRYNALDKQVVDALERSGLEQAETYNRYEAQISAQLAQIDAKVNTAAAGIQAQSAPRVTFFIMIALALLFVVLLIVLAVMVSTGNQTTARIDTELARIAAQGTNLAGQQGKQVDQLASAQAQLEKVNAALKDEQRQANASLEQQQSKINALQATVDSLSTIVHAQPTAVPSATPTTMSAPQYHVFTLKQTALSAKEAAALREFKKKYTTSGEYVLQLNLEASGKVLNFIQVDPDSALDTRLKELSQFVAQTRGLYNLWLAVQENKESVLVSSLLRARTLLTNPQQIPANALVAVDNGKLQVVLEPLKYGANQSTDAMIFRMDDALLKALNDAMPVRKQFVVLPPVGSLVLAQVEDSTKTPQKIAAIAMQEGPLLFLTSQVNAVKDGSLRAVPETTSNPLPQVVKANAAIAAPDSLVWSNGSFRINDHDFADIDLDGMMHENRVRFIRSQDDKPTWLLLQVDQVVGWVNEQNITGQPQYSALATNAPTGTGLILYPPR